MAECFYCRKQLEPDQRADPMLRRVSDGKEFSTPMHRACVGRLKEIGQRPRDKERYEVIEDDTVDDDTGDDERTRDPRT